MASPSSPHSTPASDGAPLPGERRGGATQPHPASGGKTERPTQSEVNTKDKAPPKQAPSRAAASPRAANPTGGPLGAAIGVSPKGAPPTTASRSLTDRLACKEEGVFAPPLAVQLRMLAPGQSTPVPAAAASPAAGTAPNAGVLSTGYTSQPAPAAAGGGVATGGASVPQSVPNPAKITGAYPSTTRDSMAPGPFAPSSRRSLGGGAAPFRDANQALGLTARPLQALATPSPVPAAPSHASPVQAAPSPGQSVTLTLPPTWGPGKQLRLRFGDGACALTAWIALPCHAAPFPLATHPHTHYRVPRLCVHHLPSPLSTLPPLPVFTSISSCPHPPAPHMHMPSSSPGRCLIVTPPLGLKARCLSDRATKG